MAEHLPEILRCPVCGARPDISKCDGWPKDCGPAPWSAVCYSTRPIEHCIGGNGDNQREAMEVWNADVKRYEMSHG
jgi:hypothetical protein